MTRNLAASVNARLRKLARYQRIDYNRLELLYFQERLLARLAASRYSRQFILKGGLLLYSLYQAAACPTRDLDVLGSGLPSNIETLEAIFQQVASPPLADGVEFDHATIKGRRIKEDADYGGVRLKVRGHLGQARQILQVDIGFGDAITPTPRQLDYPSLLTDEPIPLLAYSLETVIAEKFQAIVVLYTINTRYKDFYDLYQVARCESIDAGVLHIALSRTFERRSTPMADARRIFDSSFIGDQERQRQWAAYCRSLRLETDLSFENVMNTIQRFLAPVLEEEASGVWNPMKEAWSERVP